MFYTFIIESPVTEHEQTWAHCARNHLSDFNKGSLPGSELCVGKTNCNPLSRHICHLSPLLDPTPRVFSSARFPPYKDQFSTWNALSFSLSLFLSKKETLEREGLRANNHRIYLRLNTLLLCYYQEPFFQRGFRTSRRDITNDIWRVDFTNTLGCYFSMYILHASSWKNDLLHHASSKI